MSTNPESSLVLSESAHRRDDSTVAELHRSGLLSKRDRVQLAKMLGQLDLAGWVEHTDRSEPLRITDERLLRVMRVRVAAAQHARELARIAPWLLIPSAVQA